MYGKVFASMFEGSMLGAGPDVFAVWVFALSRADKKGIVELNPSLVGAMIGAPPDRVRAAINYLEQPDPESRNPEHEGRRLIKEGQFQYLIVSHFKYQAITSGDELKAYNRNAKSQERERKRAAKEAAGLLTCQ
jgi:hypothetical protein